MLYSMKVILILQIVILPLGKYGIVWITIPQNMLGLTLPTVKALSIE